MEFSKGNNSVKIKVELWFLFFVHRLIMLYICTKFCENISKEFGGYYADTIAIVKFAKGHNSVKM